MMHTQNKHWNNLKAYTLHRKYTQENSNVLIFNCRQIFDIFDLKKNM